MDVITIDQIKMLGEQTESQCVSIYMPTIQAGAETQQNPIRFKNLIKQVEIQLKEQGLRQTDAVRGLQINKVPVILEGAEREYPSHG